MTTKEQKIQNFDPNGLGVKGSNLFGLPFTEEESETIVIPVPWEVTVSYSAGTAEGPEAILNASLQVDLYDPYFPEGWKKGIYMIELPQSIAGKSAELRVEAVSYLNALEEGGPINEKKHTATLEKINNACKEMVSWVQMECEKQLKKGKRVILLGGDHSTPLGYFKALSEIYPAYGILQIDAHADLRDAYEGFEFSHASIMFNALKIPQVKKLVQVGIRDYSEGEVKLIENSNKRIVTFFDRTIKHEKYQGKCWKDICFRIISELPENVYISFDIDGLDPKLCPNTGTPVPGGFEFEEVLFLLQLIAESGKKIIGFDLNEVAPGENEWNTNVAARLLYRINNIISKSEELRNARKEHA